MIPQRVVAIALAALCPFLPSAAYAQEQANGEVRASVAEPLYANTLADLSFGAVVVSQDEGGSVEVSAIGAPPVYSGAVRPGFTGSATNTPHPARFTVRGQALRRYRVEIPAELTAIGDTTGAALNIAALTIYSKTGPSSPTGGLLDKQGEDEFAVGATLIVPAGTQTDVFRAELPVTVTYE